jgi:hypothetical protein
MAKMKAGRVTIRAKAQPGSSPGMHIERKITGRVTSRGGHRVDRAANEAQS